MSCENPSSDGDTLMVVRKKYDKTKLCVKCKVNLGNLVVRHAVYCKECFVPFTATKFRRSVEPFVNPEPNGPRRTALKPSGDLLIGYSGGLGSSVLLDLVHRSYVLDKARAETEGGRRHPRNDRVWKKITVCYVEVCDVFPGMKDKTEEVRDTVSAYEGVEFLPLRIQDAFDHNWWRQVGHHPDLSPFQVNISGGDLHLESPPHPSPQALSALQGYLSSLPTPTALTTAVKSLVRILLQYTALSTGCSHLLLGTSLTSLAVALISGVCQGDGFHIREETQEEWRPEHVGSPSGERSGKVNDRADEPSVRVIRPLRDVGMKECGAWAWWMGVKVVGREKWNWPGIKQGIGFQTRDFIVGLERDYPSTVSAIVRTCGKLAPKGEVIGRCILCERPLPQGVQDWKSQISIRSRRGGPLGDTNPDLSISGASLAPYLCYACHTTLTSRSSRAGIPSITSTVLPTWAHSNIHGVGPPMGFENGEVVVSKLVSESDMHRAVKEFLLEG